MHIGKAKVVFMGSPDFAIPSLEAVASASDFEMVLVVSQPDRARGRGRRVEPTPVRGRAISIGLPTLVMTKKNYGDVAREIEALKPAFIAVVAFGLILKKDLLTLPSYGCVNLHASLLPKFRGVSPVQAALLEGEKVTGCTTILMDEGVDTGEILLSREVEVLPDDTSETLGGRLSEVGAGLLIETLKGLERGEITPRKQDHNLATYTRKIRKEDGLIDWYRDAEALERHVRAMYPWPTAYTFYAGRRLILLGARGVENDSLLAPPGTVLSLVPFVVACGKGAIEVTRLKAEGKRALSSEAFVSGCSIKKGDSLG